MANRKKATLEEIFGLIVALKEAIKANPLPDEDDDDEDGLRYDSQLSVSIDDETGKPDDWVEIGDSYYGAEIEGSMNEVRSELERRIKAVTSRPRTISVEDVGDYTAKVTEGGIRVGCQTISFEALDNIVKAANEIRPKTVAKKTTRKKATAVNA